METIYQILIDRIATCFIFSTEEKLYAKIGELKTMYPDSIIDYLKIEL